MGDLSKNFSRSEFACPCCGEAPVTGELIDPLQVARDHADYPFVITLEGGYRCPDYNEVIGASPTSSHTKALAVDLAVTNSRAAFKVMSGLIKAGFTRIGWNQKRKFIHADVDKDKPAEVLFHY